LGPVAGSTLSCWDKVDGSDVDVREEVGADRLGRRTAAPARWIARVCSEASGKKMIGLGAWYKAKPGGPFHFRDIYPQFVFLWRAKRPPRPGLQQPGPPAKS